VFIYENKMDKCSEKHTPAYKITYRGAKSTTYKPEWLVCEWCHEKRIFGTLDDIVSLEKLN
jgi:hypothetical protein